MREVVGEIDPLDEDLLGGGGVGLILEAEADLRAVLVPIRRRVRRSPVEARRARLEVRVVAVEIRREVDPTCRGGGIDCDRLWHVGILVLCSADAQTLGGPSGIACCPVPQIG